MRFALIYLLVNLTTKPSILVHADNKVSAEASGRNGDRVQLPFCEARSINHILQCPPPVCLHNEWNSDPTALHAHDTDRTTGFSSPQSTLSSRTIPVTESAVISQTSIEPEETSFMSFEDWKEMMLQKAGQEAQDMRRRKTRETAAEDRTPYTGNQVNLGDTSGIPQKCNDNAHRDNSQHCAGVGTGAGASNEVDEIHVPDETSPSMYRRKDAGRTCKERFSYSSFDAGATVLKTGPSTKNAKAILVENKDSYMLLECAKNKFVIIELSDVVFIDTIVLANFEFFSSMIRHFRVSVSGRFPVKIDKWEDLGLFEARNSRDMQPFLVENHTTGARYLRIEFLTHYGNEYYCPVSLLRVHGSRMLDPFEDGGSGGEEGINEKLANELLAHDVLEAAKLGASKKSITYKETQDADGFEEPSAQELFTPATAYDFTFQLMTCPIPISTLTKNSTRSQLSTAASNEQPRASSRSNGWTNSSAGITTIVSTSEEASMAAMIQKAGVNASSKRPIPMYSEVGPRLSSGSASETLGSASASSMKSITSSSSKLPLPSSTTHKNRVSSSASVPAVTPTIPQGYFNTVTKRLQQLESNMTLSLKYIEDQSRSLQEVLQRAEQKQTNKVALFLENLNQTVLNELRTIREQCDHFWQSTIIALDTHKDSSGRDVIALSARLNLLADEVVFQKRMAIVQAILLLSCLFLVIFSRGVPIPYLAPFLDQNISAYADPTSTILHERDSIHSQRRDNSQMTPYPRLSQIPSTKQLFHTTSGSARGAPSNRSSFGHGCPELELNGADQVSSHSLSIPDVSRVDLHGTAPPSMSDRDSIQSQLHHSISRKPLPALPEYSNPQNGPMVKL